MKNHTFSPRRILLSLSALCVSIFLYLAVFSGYPVSAIPLVLTQIDVGDVNVPTQLFAANIYVGNGRILNNGDSVFWGNEVYYYNHSTGLTSLVSLSSDEVPAEISSSSSFASFSSDGRYIAFVSDATNLVAGDANNVADVFLRDTQLGTTIRVSVATDGTEGDGDSHVPYVSSDGRYVIFESDASNLVAGDTNGLTDIFIRDTEMNTTSLVSVATDGTKGDISSSDPSISTDGRYVTFISDSTNLVAGDTNAVSDVFLRDTQAGTTVRVSVADDESEGNDGAGFSSISSDGRYVAFYSDATNLIADDTNGVSDIFLRDTQAETTVRISVADDESESTGGSDSPSVSSDGRYVAFESSADNLVAGDTNVLTDIFLRDTQTGTTTRMSVATDGTQADAISSYSSVSPDGRYVIFGSNATNLAAHDVNSNTDVFLRDTQTSTTTLISHLFTTQSFGSESDTSFFLGNFSSDNRYIVFESGATNLVANDFNAYFDIFMRDTQTSTTTRISVGDDESEANESSYNSSVSADGRYVIFESLASNLVAGDTNVSYDIFMRDTQAGATTRISVGDDESEGNAASQNSSLSSDGRYVVFESQATNLVADDTNILADVFLRDTQTNTTTRVSVGDDESEGDGESYNPSISADGRYIVFFSTSSNLIVGDTNAASDIFIRDTQAGTTTRVSVADDESEGDSDAISSRISSDGRYVVFDSYAANLVVGDSNVLPDIFLRDTQAGTTIRVSVGDDESEGNDFPGNPSVSSDGRYVAFISDSTNLVAGDTNAVADVFLRDTQAGTTTRVSVKTDGTEADNYSSNPSISPDGSFISFTSYATNLLSVAGPAEGNYFLAQVVAAVPPPPPPPSSGTWSGSVYYPPIPVVPAQPILPPLPPDIPTPPVPAPATPIIFSCSSSPVNIPAVPADVLNILPSNLDLTNILKIGATNSIIKIYQKFLNSQGYIVSDAGFGSIGNETIYFRLKTQKAVKKFQEDYCLEPDGIIGPKTKGVIKIILETWLQKI